MATLDKADRRLQNRALNKGEAAADNLHKAVLSEPDSAENATHASAEDLEDLSQELAREKELRDQRIQKTLATPNEAKAPLEAEAPLDDEL